MTKRNPFAKDVPETPSKAPSSPMETTAGSEQRPDHTGVIRRADEAVRVELERLQAVARGLSKVIEAYKADISDALQAADDRRSL
jgi:hypothetical protein